MILTQVGGILKPFAWLFGVIFNWLYELLSLVGIENIAITLVLFTIIVKMLMLPLTVKQQRFSKLSAKMQPELTAITEKYKGRKDETTQRLMAQEQQRVYEKYGTSPTSGCLPILITFPIIIAMYRIIYAIPAYVDKINDLYISIAQSAMAQEGYFEFFSDIAGKLAVSMKKWDEVEAGVMNSTHIIDILTKFGTDNWAELLKTFPALNTAAINGSIEKINSIFSVFGLNILNSPSYYAKLNGFFNIALLVPVLAVVTQLASSLLSKAQNKTGKKNEENAMAQSMNSMLYIMPFMSGIFCYGFSLVIGIYWIINTVVSLLQQIFINIYLDHSDMEAYIAKNSAKLAKKRERLGVLQGSSAVSNLAKYQTKSIDYSKPAPVKTTSSYAAMGASSKNSGKQKSNSSANVNSSESAEESDNVQVNAPEKKSVSAYANLLKRD